MRRERGFTLMELLIVVAIMLILATVGFSNFVFSIKKAHDAERKSDLSTIAKGLEAFANDFGSYPGSNGFGQIVGCAYGAGPLEACDWGDPFAAYLGVAPDGGVQTYLATLPTDPVPQQIYFYQETSTGYNLYAALENTSDPSYQSGLTVECGAGVTCNYLITESGVN